MNKFEVSITNQKIIRVIYFLLLILLSISSYYTYEDAYDKGDNTVKFLAFACMVMCIIFSSVQLRNLAYKAVYYSDRLWYRVILLFNLIFFGIIISLFYFAYEDNYFGDGEVWLYVLMLAAILVFVFTIAEYVSSDMKIIAGTLKDIDTAHAEKLESMDTVDYILSQSIIDASKRKKSTGDKATSDSYGFLAQHIKM